jgi:hypothetical protein
MPRERAKKTVLIDEYSRGGPFTAMVFDAVVSEAIEDSTQITEHPIENGSKISDHVIRNPRKITLETIVSNHPITINESLTVEDIIGAASFIGTNENTPRQESGEAVGLTAQYFNPKSPVEDRAGAAYKVMASYLHKSIPLKVVCGLSSFGNMVVTNIATTRNASNGASWVSSITLQEALIVRNRTIPILAPEIPPTNAVELASAPKEEVNKLRMDFGIGPGTGGFGSIPASTAFNPVSQKYYQELKRAQDAGNGEAILELLEFRYGGTQAPAVRAVQEGNRQRQAGVVRYQEERAEILKKQRGEIYQRYKFDVYQQMILEDAFVDTGISVLELNEYTELYLITTGELGGRVELAPNPKYNTPERLAKQEALDRSSALDREVFSILESGL